jgi:hypothetical protein
MMFHLCSRASFAVLALTVFLLAGALSPADAAVVRSWDSANQRGGDLFSSGGGDLEYGDFRAALLGRGHTVLPGISTLSAANLAGVNVFFWGTTSRVSTGAELAALADFIEGGGCLIIEANSLSSEQDSANAALNALGLGNPYTGVTGGVNSATGGLFSAANVSTLVGPLGDLRGLDFGTSIVAELNPAGGTAVGSVGSLVSWVQFQVGAGGVLAVGDPYGFGLFYDGFLGNPNNANAYLNFIEGKQQNIPEPTTLALCGLMGAGLVGYRLRRRMKAVVA